MKPGLSCRRAPASEASTIVNRHKNSGRRYEGERRTLPKGELGAIVTAISSVSRRLFFKILLVRPFGGGYHMLSCVMVARNWLAPFDRRVWREAQALCDASRRVPAVRPADKKHSLKIEGIVSYFARWLAAAAVSPQDRRSDAGSRAATSNSSAEITLK